MKVPVETNDLELQTKSPWGQFTYMYEMVNLQYMLFDDEILDLLIQTLKQNNSLK